MKNDLFESLTLFNAHFQELKFYRYLEVWFKSNKNPLFFQMQNDYILIKNCETDPGGILRVSLGFDQFSP